MARPRPSPDEDEDLDDLGISDEVTPRSRGEGRERGRTRRHARRGPVRSWDPSGADDITNERDDLVLPGDDEEDREKRPIFWRARDSLYFEPLVALAIVALLLVSFYAYTSNWPPVYAIESNSMQHGPGDHLGYLNAGDVILAQKIPTSSIIPFVVGATNGYQTYGEPGDVLLYYPNGQTGKTPIIHRAVLFLEWNPARLAYNATDLGGLNCSDHSPSTSWYVTGATPACGATNLTTGDTLHIYHVGQDSVTLAITIDSALGAHSGFVTLGDNNTNIYDQYDAGSGTPKISSLVEPSWIIGVARGMIPWFGAIKLVFDGNAGNVSGASWEFLGLTIAGLIALAIGIHYVFRREGFESRLRRREEEAARPPPRDEDEDEEEPTVGHRFMSALRPWNAEEEPEPEPKQRGAKPRPSTYEERRRSHFVSHHKRPRPHGRRTGRKDPDDDDEDL
jgi:signal peptidase I